MNNEGKLKKYFIKDVELTKLEEDKLDYKDLVKNIELIIDNTEPPFNIAVIGKSGTGKSSIINFLTTKYKNDPENYNVEEINVWKNNISIKDFLESKYNKIEDNQSKEYNQINDENVVYIGQYEDNNINKGKDDSNLINNTNKKINNKTLKIILAICNTILTFVVCFFITSVLFVLMEYFQNKNIYKINDIFFVENTYLNYMENIGLIMLFSVLLSGIAIICYKLFIKKDKHKKDNNVIYSNTSTNLNISNYNVEENLKKDINTIETNTQQIKNIIIIEDIDKLAVAKIIKTLEEIRYCNEYENCIFIVPLEKNILKKAIEIRNVVKASTKYKPLNFEKIFDKIFQFKINIPQLPSTVFKEYAVDLVQENIPNFIDEYCESKVIESVIRNILIYKNVTTPRHVKKLINCFVNNKLLAYHKYENGDIDEDYIKSEKFDFQLAKISVIQLDFEEFYDVLFKDFSYLDKLSELYSLKQEELKVKYNEIDEELKPFFKAKYKSLRSFLRQTRNYTIDDMATLMYLTKNTNEKLFKGRPISSYIIGDENILDWSNQQISELITFIDNNNDLKEFLSNNFKKLLEKNKDNFSDKNYFMEFNENIMKNEEFIGDVDYLKYLKLVAINYNYYPDKAIQIFKYSKVQITEDIMKILLDKLEENLSPENYQDTFEIIRDNSECFYSENGNISRYVQFLVDYIYMSPDPNEVIVELDENFNRIGNIYELNKNIKGLKNLDFDKAYKFIAKCLDNSDLNKVVYVINSILSDDNSIKDCINIEKKMKKYSLLDVIEYNVDQILELENAKLGINIQNDNDSDDEKNKEENVDFQKNNSNEEVISLENNYKLLKNLLKICVIKQIHLNANDVIKIVEKALVNVKDSKYILSIYNDVLNKFDRMYFYELKRDFNEVIYTNFHTSKSNAVKEAALKCVRYFKITRLFKTKLTKSEEKFYNEN